MQDTKMEIRYSARFRQQFKKANKKIRKAFYQRRILFEQNPHSPLLKNHRLAGKFAGYRSINVTGDWRAIYSQEKNLIIFEMIGTHSQLYR